MRTTMYFLKQMQLVAALIFLFILCSLNESSGQIPEWSWANSATGATEDASLAVTADNSGNSFAAGYFQSSTITFDATVLTNSGVGHDVFLAKYDTQGDLLWAKSAGGTDSEKPYGVGTDGSGNVYMVGFFRSSNITFGAFTLNNAGNSDLFIVKYDGDGNVIWAQSAGGGGNDEAKSVTTDASGNVYVSGQFQSSTLTFGGITLNNSSAGGNTEDLFVVKFNSSGTALWAKSAGLSAEADYANTLDVDPSGNLLVGGWYASSSITFGATTLSNSGAGSNDPFLVKYDANGNVLWAKDQTSGGTGQDYFHAIGCDGSGNVYAAGYFRSSTITFGSTTLSNVGEHDVYLIKYDASGNVVWATSAGGTLDEKAYGIGVNGSDIYMAGTFVSSSLTFGSFTLNNPGGGTDDIYVAKYDASGNVDDAEGIGGSSHDQAHSLYVDAGGNGYMSGTFASGTLTFGSSTVTNSTCCDFDMFIAKWGALSCTVPTGLFASNISTTEAKVNWTAVPAANKYKVRYRETGTNTWTKASTLNNYKKLKNLTAATEYDWQVKSLCGDLGLGTSDWSATQNFTTDELRVGSEQQMVAKIYPNPFSYNTVVSFECEENSRVQILLYDLAGSLIKPVIDENIETGIHDIVISRDQIVAGIYLLQLRINEVRTIQKIVVE